MRSHSTSRPLFARARRARQSGAPAAPPLPHGNPALFARYLRAACWAGTALFLLAGALAGYSYGAQSGSSFFGDLYPVNQAGAGAAAIGVSCGALLGLLALWVLCTVVCVMLGALAYCLKFRGVPLPK
jgi:hypothetical protein